MSIFFIRCAVKIAVTIVECLPVWEMIMYIRRSPLLLLFLLQISIFVVSNQQSDGQIPAEYLYLLVVIKDYESAFDAVT